MLVLLMGLLLRVVLIFGAPEPLALWSARVRAQAGIAAAWVLSCVAIAAAGWVLIVVYLPSMTDLPRYDMSLLRTPAAIVPGLLGLVMGMQVHAQLVVRLIERGRRYGFTSAALHIDHTFGAGDPRHSTAANSH